MGLKMDTFVKIFLGLIIIFLLAIPFMAYYDITGVSAFKAKCEGKGGIMLTHTTHTGKYSNYSHTCVNPGALIEID